MGFAEEVAAQKRFGHRSSRIYEVRDALGKEWDDFLVLLGDESTSAPQIGRALRNRGFAVDDSTIAYWRRKRLEGWQP